MPTVIARGAIRSRCIAQALFVLYSRSSDVLALLAVVVGLAGAYASCIAAGGSHSAAPHLFYVPIVLGAVRFSWPGAATSVLAAGLLAGPVLPADVAGQVEQPVQGWLLRLVMFAIVGLLVAWLVRGRGEPMRAELYDTLVSGQVLRAIDRGEIEVFYQPVVRLADRRVTGLEALARWHHPRRGYISPAEFIPAAERTGAITAIDRHVLRVAAKQAQLWSTDLGPLTISVNVSATRFAQRDLSADVSRVLNETGLPSHALQLEITESALIDDVDAASAQIAQLRELGVRVAIDDFGAGQASLGYLSHFDVNTVKLDRSLIAEVATAPRTTRLVAGVIGLFQGLDLDVVAEGVENTDQLLQLDEAGCRLVQGFFFGRPASTPETTALLVAAHDARCPDTATEPAAHPRTATAATGPTDRKPPAATVRSPREWSAGATGGSHRSRGDGSATRAADRARATQVPAAPADGLVGVAIQRGGAVPREVRSWRSSVPPTPGHLA